MSADYGCYCLDCEDRLIVEDLRSPPIAAELIANAEKLAKLRQDFHLSDIEFQVSYGRRADLSWFELHGDHRLVVIDEYGGRWPRCQGKGGDIFCLREKEHEGKCSEKGLKTKEQQNG